MEDLIYYMCFVARSRLVEEARAGSFIAARAIVRLSHDLLHDNRAKDANHALRGLLEKFRYSEYARLSFDEVKNAVDKYRDVLGDEFHDYLFRCLEKLVYDQELDMREGIAFGISPGPGQHDTDHDIERYKEIALNADAIDIDLKSGSLLKGANSYLSGRRSDLPMCVEDILKLRGFRITEDHKPDVRRELALAIRHAVTGQGVGIEVTATVYQLCYKALGALIQRILDCEYTSKSDRTRLLELRSTLPDYSGLGEHSVEKYKAKYKDMEMPSQNREVDPFDPMFEDLEGWLLPQAFEADRLIKSEDVGNHMRDALVKLEKETPPKYQQTWPGLNKRFMAAALQRQREKDQSEQQIEKD